MIIPPPGTVVRVRAARLDLGYGFSGTSWVTQVHLPPVQCLLVDVLGDHTSWGDERYVLMMPDGAVLTTHHDFVLQPEEV